MKLLCKTALTIHNSVMEIMPDADLLLTLQVTYKFAAKYQIFFSEIFLELLMKSALLIVTSDNSFIEAKIRKAGKCDTTEQN